MNKNDFLNGGLVMATILVTVNLVYNMGRTKGYTEGLKYQKERMDIYNHGYADGCKQFNKTKE